ncbi:MAG TPA: hypothetical protein VGJ20_20570 [Xanthobacteraceae bacterium]|jgi:hypothetical protein
MAQVPAINDEAKAISDEAASEGGFQPMIKFKKGDYLCDGEEVPLGTRYIAHAIGWTKTWVKFENRTVVDRKVYRVARKERCPERDQLPDLDEKFWGPGLDGRPADPWVLQYLLPMEDETTGEVRIFVGSSFGGRRAVAELCTAYGRRAAKQGGSGQPIVELQTVDMPTKNYGDVPRPKFEIVGWDDGDAAPERREEMSKVTAAAAKRAEFDDAIPF